MTNMNWKRVPWYTRLWRKLFPPKDISIHPKCENKFPRYTMSAPIQGAVPLGVYCFVAGCTELAHGSPMMYGPNGEKGFFCKDHTQVLLDEVPQPEMKAWHEIEAGRRVITQAVLEAANELTRKNNSVRRPQ